MRPYFGFAQRCGPLVLFFRPFRGAGWVWLLVGGLVFLKCAGCM